VNDRNMRPSFSSIHTCDKVIESLELSPFVVLLVLIFPFLCMLVALGSITSSVIAQGTSCTYLSYSYLSRWLGLSLSLLRIGVSRGF
jgi:ABC-type methionine transport system permease subunit